MKALKFSQSHRKSVNCKNASIGSRKFAARAVLHLESFVNKTNRDRATFRNARLSWKMASYERIKVKVWECIPPMSGR